MLQIQVRLDKLLGLLDKVSELYETLLAVIDSEKNAVIDANLRDLNNAAKVKENLLLKLRILDEQRNHSLGQLAGLMEQSPQGLTLRKLSKMVPEPYASRLKHRRVRLLALLRNIHEANENNGALIGHSLELVKGSVNLLNNIMTASPVYHKNGNIQNRDRAGKILCGEI